jgi:hypothetical protein
MESNEVSTVDKLSVDDSFEDEQEWAILHDETDKLWGFQKRFKRDAIKLRDVSFAIKANMPNLELFWI